MDRIKIFILAFVTMGLVSCQTTTSRPSSSASKNESWTRARSNEFRGAWVYDPRRFEPDDVVRSLKEAGFTAVFVRLSSAGAAYYPSAVLPKAPGTDRDYAAAYAAAGRKYGLEIHAWHVCFMMHYASKSAVASAIKKGEVMRNARGQAIRPTYNVPVRTPALASNRTLEENAMVELITKYPLDGVQFDYIRYFSPGVDYSATARAAFEKTIGRKIKKWPSEVVSGPLKGRYKEWKAGLVTSLVRTVSRAVKTSNPSAKVSAAVWHSPEVGLNDYAQDWVRWIHEGYLDFVVPMNYTTSDRRLLEWIENQQQLIKGKVPLYAGIGSYMLKTSSQVNRQINVCRQAGLGGYVLYSYDEAAKDNLLSEIKN